VKLQTFIVPLFVATALASGCADQDPRYGRNEYPIGTAHSNENYYAVIDSIEARPAGDEANANAHAATEGASAGHESNGRQNVYVIRVRFDDRSYRTVTQTSLNGLRVGDSVRIEDDRVRRY
jgi:hypothetical protein